MPILVLAVVSALIFLVIGILGVSAVLKEHREQLRGEKEGHLKS